MTNTTIHYTNNQGTLRIVSRAVNMAFLDTESMARSFRPGTLLLEVTPLEARALLLANPHL